MTCASQRVTETMMTTSSECPRLNNLCECARSNELIIHTEHLSCAQGLPCASVLLAVTHCNADAALRTR